MPTAYTIWQLQQILHIHIECNLVVVQSGWHQVIQPCVAKSVRKERNLLQSLEGSCLATPPPVDHILWGKHIQQAPTGMYMNL